MLYVSLLIGGLEVLKITLGYTDISIFMLIVHLTRITRKFFQQKLYQMLTMIN